MFGLANKHPTSTYISQAFSFKQAFPQERCRAFTSITFLRLSFRCIYHHTYILYAAYLTVNNVTCSPGQIAGVEGVCAGNIAERPPDEHAFCCVSM